MLPKKLFILMAAICGLVATLPALVPPHPKYANIPIAYQSSRMEIPMVSTSDGSVLSRPKTIPNNILVLRVQFSDVSFVNTPTYPDYLAHDDAFFDRWMLHLSDFYADASHGAYELDYTLWPTVFTLPRPMAYYGGDSPERIDVRVAELAAELLAMADPEIDFRQYGGLIIFHAGAGQESDINGIRTDQIWSTFLTRKVLQAAFDPNNDNYPGLVVDGNPLINIVVVPEWEWQDYFPGEGQQDSEVYLFSIYGVLAHQFGHVLGLPTLFDNDSSNGRSQGIGNWGLMGTGVWNASGYVPAQLTAWSRYFLGWENVITLQEDSIDVGIDYFLDHAPGRNRLYKLPISGGEYFLVENRQQNPDGSLDPYSNQPSFTFKLLPEGEQDYYENYPLLPFFNFMENRYAGCEWDFFLPGLGGPLPSGSSVLQDGSGLLIWHIDENVIAQNFTTNFDLNRINANAQHKGVDLEEGDGIQHLDTAVYDPYKWGSPFDAFRAGNNDYFGNPIHNGVLSLPSAESYYGGVALEVFDISASANQMTFSVSFGWALRSAYEGENPFNASMIDFDGDGEKEIFYPMPDGQLYMWKDELLMSGFPVQRQPIVKNYVWDGTDIYLPMQLDEIARLYRLGDSSQYVENFSGYQWASHPVNVATMLYLPLNSSTSTASQLYAYEKATASASLLTGFDDPIACNMVWFRGKLHIITHQAQSSYRMWTHDPATMNLSFLNLDVPGDSTLVGVFRAPVLPNSQHGEILVQTPNAIYLLDNAGQKVNGFPYVHDLNATAPLTLADIDMNGSLDIILSGDNGILVLDYSGTRISPESLYGAAPEDGGISSGALALDIDADGKPEILGNFSYNRLNVWEHDFKRKSGFPVSYAERSRNLPVIGPGSDGKIYAWSAADNGRIHRSVLPDARMQDLDSRWISEYANLERHASRDHVSLPNQFTSTKTFVDGEVYIFPNPLKSIYANKLTLSVMTSRDTPLEISIFDISGTLLYRQMGQARAYLRNREVIDIPAAKLASGVYIMVIKSSTESTRLKFAVEK